MTPETILSQLKSLGYETVPDSWYQHISDWDAWYCSALKASLRSVALCMAPAGAHVAPTEP